MPTPIYIDSFQHRTLRTQGAGRWYDAITDPATTPAHDGTQVTYDSGNARTADHAVAVKLVSDITNGSSFRADIPFATAVMVGSIYFKFSSTPAGSVPFVATDTVAGAPDSCTFRITTTGAISCQVATGTLRTSASTYADGAWHRLDWKYDSTTTTGTTDWRIDGGSAETQATGTITAGNHTDLRLGSPSAINTLTYYLSDLVLSETSADYPIGDHICLMSEINATGTHSKGAGAFTDQTGATSDAALLAAVDDAFNGTTPNLTQTGEDYVAQTANDAAGYVDFGFEDTTYTLVWAVQLGALMATLDSTTASNGETRLVHSGTTYCTTGLADPSGSATIYNGFRTLASTGPGGSWSDTEFNAATIRFGFSTDAAPDTLLNSAMVEYVAPWSAADNETVTPATVAAIAAVPAPTISVGGPALVTPSTVVATAAVPAPTIRGAAVVAPSTVAAIAAVPAPTLRSHRTVTPSTVAAVAAIPAPTVRGNAVMAAATVAAVATVPAPTSIGGPAFVPTDITGLNGWWDFSDASILFEDAGTNLVEADDSIQYVEDKSSSANPLQQSSVSLRPQYKTGIINGLSVARFDGAIDHLVSNTRLDTSFTVFIVAKKRSAPAAADKSLFYLSPEARLYTNSTAGFGTGFIWDINSAASPVAVPATPANTNVIVLHVTSITELNIYLNGSDSAAVSFNPDDTVTTELNFYFGSDFGGGSPGDYDIGEIVAYDSSLSLTNIDLVGEYLADKWGTSWTSHTPDVPETVEGLQGWWDASDIDGLWLNVARDSPVTADGQTVASWDDVSGGGHHLMQNASTAQEPSYETSMINGLSVLRFDGIDNYLTNDTAPFSADTSFTVFILARKNSAISVATDVLFAMEATPKSMLFTDSSHFASNYIWDTNEAGGHVNVGGTPTSVNVIVLRVASASSMNIRMNGGAGTTFDPDVAITTGIQYIVGIGATFITNFGDYDVGEIISYDSALSDADIDIVGEYLADKWGTTWTAVGVTNEIVTPATVAAVASVPAPTVQATARVAPATVAAVAAVPAPTLAATARPTPATVAAVASVPAPTVRGVAIVAPATVVAVAAIPAPTLASHRVVTPATVAAIAAVPAPTVTVAGDVLTAPATVVAVASVPAPTVSATAIATPVTVAAIAQVPASTLAGTARVTPATVAAVASVPAPTVLATALVAPATVVAVASLPAPTISGTAIVQPATVAAIGQVPAPSLLVGGSVSVGPATVAAIAQVPAPTIGYSTLVAPATVAAVAAVPAPTVIAGASVATSPATVVAIASLPAPTLRGAARPTPATIVAIAVIPAPTVVGGASAISAPATVVAIALVPGPTLRGSAQPTPATIAAIALVPAPTVVGVVGVVVSPATITAFATIPGPSRIGQFVIVRPQVVSRPLGHYGGTSPFRLKSPTRRVRR